MTANAMNLDEMKLVLNTEKLSASDIQKAQELEKSIYTDENFIAAQDVKAACQAIAQRVNRTQEELMAKYEELKASLTEQFKSLMGERELTDEELDAVDGGSLFNKIGAWFKKNWKAVVAGAVLGATMAVAATFTLGLGITIGAGMAGAVIGGGAAALIIEGRKR